MPIPDSTIPNIDVPQGMESLALAAVASGALSGVKQLLKELADVLPPEALERVREEVGKGIRASGLPEPIAEAMERNLR
ncbi:hypothetical protein [Sphingomonas paucimobilis]|uniref:hypothetical protein n=1 Tax=Sphingomonas paucimobilis TaxID=13689 RepID=UPI0030F6EE20